MQFGDCKEGVEQFFHTHARDGTGLHDLCFATPFRGQQLIDSQLLIDPLHVGARQIDFIENGDDF